MCSASSAQVQSAQSLAVLRIVMQQQRGEGQAAVALMQDAGRVQAPLPQERGKGALVDVTA